MSSETNCIAFGALHRLLVVVAPEGGEAGWQEAHAFNQLPEPAKKAGNWYRGIGSGFIHVDENLNGEFVKSLPADVDPETVVSLVSTNHASVLETMNALIPGIEPKLRETFQARLDALIETSSSAHPRNLVRKFREEVFTASIASTQDLLDYLAKTSEDFLSEGMVQGRVAGIEAAALLLIRRLAEAIAPEVASAKRVLMMLAAPGPVKIETVVGQFVRDCIHNGFSVHVESVLTELLREGDGLVSGAQEGYYPVGRQDMMLQLYYFGLLGAAPYLRAAMVGYEVSSQNPVLSEEQRTEKMKFANAAEEKLVRVSAAMLFAVKDLDGTEGRFKRAAIQTLLNAGDEDKAYGIAMEAVDLNLFYPKPFKKLLLTPDSKE